MLTGFFGEFDDAGEGEAVDEGDGGESGVGGEAGEFVGEDDASAIGVAGEAVERDVGLDRAAGGGDEGGFFDVAAGHADGFVAAFARADGIVFTMVFPVMPATGFFGGGEEGKGAGFFSSDPFFVEIADGFDGGFGFPPLASDAPFGEDLAGGLTSTRGHVSTPGALVFGSREGRCWRGGRFWSRKRRRADEQWIGRGVRSGRRTRGRDWFGGGLRV